MLPPCLGTSPAALTFNGTQGGANPPTQDIAVSDPCSTQVLNWTVTESPSAAWISEAPTSGSTPSSTTVSISLTGLTPATYYDTLSFAASGASNSPLRVPVTLTVSAAVAAGTMSIKNLIIRPGVAIKPGG